jgi:hypothetical protein
MFVYSKDGQDYILMANSARGVMKISVESIDSTKPIAERISGVAGLKYETIAKLKGVEQLDRLGKDRALVLVKGDGAMKLQSIQLP